MLIRFSAFIPFLVLVLMALPGSAQDVDPMDVDEAIDKGRRWLLQQGLDPFSKSGHMFRNDELIFYTLKHAGEDLSKPGIQKRIEAMLKLELDRTYCVTLQAMFLQDYDAVSYQWRIVQCCQFLVDNQCVNGQWSYGSPTKKSNDVQTGTTRKDVETAGKGGESKPRKPKIRITIKPQRKGPASGDNSNSQYAALGLRACIEANVHPPKGTFVNALKHWETTQNQDGGWGYTGKASYGSMTSGAVASIIIYRGYSRMGWKSARSVLGGVAWMANNFTVEDNPYQQAWWHYYYLYALERVGMLSGIKKIGPHDWYQKGARYLLDQQKEDGRWVNKTLPKKDRAIWDTCFAILFLKRATTPVATSSSSSHGK